MKDHNIYSVDTLFSVISFQRWKKITNLSCLIYQGFGGQTLTLCKLVTQGSHRL